MKRLLSSPHQLFKALASVALTFLAMTMLHPATASANTSGGATIYNTVKVNYTSGSTTLFATANVSVTVATVATNPTVTNPADQTVTSGTAVSYNYELKSNSNGPETFTTAALTNTPANIPAATGTSVTASVSLWGGITVGSAAGTISIPYGTTTGLTDGTSIIQIGATNRYLVAAGGIVPGSAASTDGAGNLVAEVPATLTLTPLLGAPPITAALGAGVQVGEYKTAALTAALTAGNPTTAGTNGTYSTTYTLSTTTDPAVNLTTAAVITTVSSPRVTIAKTVNPNSGVKPGDTLTYTITVTNTHATAAATSVTVIDPVPAYTTYVANSTRLNTKTVASDGAASPLIAGILVDSDVPPRTAGDVSTGILPPLGVATITFQVTVN